MADSESKSLVSMLSKMEINSDDGTKSVRNTAKDIDNIFYKNLSPEIKAETDWNSVCNIMWKDLPATDLPSNSQVYVSYINNPLDFVVL